MSVSLDTDLIGVDKLGKRWGKFGLQPGTLHPLEAIRKLREGAVLGGGSRDIPQDIAAWIDCHSAADRQISHLLTVWYCTHWTSRQVVADRIGCSRATVYNRRTNALWYMKAALKAKGFSL